MNHAQIDDMIQICNDVYYNSSNEEDNDKYTFQNSIEGDTEIGATIDNVSGELINSKFRYPIDKHKGATGTIIEKDWVIYVQKCLLGELYYTPYKIYGDPKIINDNDGVFYWCMVALWQYTFV